MSLRTKIAFLNRRRKWRTLIHEETAFLRKLKGVIHVGANTGQERETYNSFGLRVLWIEPISSVFETLMKNIAPYPSQQALNYLVTEDDGNQYEFHIANNAGESSSILNLAKHRDMFPHVSYSKTIKLWGVRLGTALDREGIDPSLYDGMVMDTQGSELQILKGAAGLLPRFRYLKIEVPDFESYEGCCTIDQLSAFLKAHGFREDRRIPLKIMAGVGTYFEVIYRRR